MDSVATGKGVYDNLTGIQIWSPYLQRYVDVAEFKGSHAAPEKDYFLNARAAGYWRLREAFEQGLVDLDPHDEDLFYELSELRFDRTAADKVVIESKKKFKERTGISPDNADALMMAFAGPSVRKATVL